MMASWVTASWVEHFVAYGFLCLTSPPGGVVGNMLASGIHSDSDDHYNGGPVSLDPQWHVKEPWRR